MKNSVSSSLARWLAAWFVLALAACQGIQVRPDQSVHLVCADADGGYDGPLVEGQPKAQRNHTDHAQRIADAYERSGCTRVMLVVHGGLVEREAGIEHSLQLLAKMREDPTMQDTFPIFVIWETGIGRSYADHLFGVRQGCRQPLLASLTSPFVLLADLGRALVRVPITVSTQLGNLAAYYVAAEPAGVPGAWATSAGLDRSDENDPWTATLGDVGLELVPGIARVITGPLLDAAGVPAYKNMRRRARVLFVRDHDHDGDQHRLSGALPQLMEALVAVKRRPRFTLIAHSMGTLVVNELIQRYGHRSWPEELRGRMSGSSDTEQMTKARTMAETPLAIEHIVYMGAACTVREFAGSVLPHLRSNAAARFYNLCLHPFDELDDRYAGGVVPNGSLLEWIDDYITEQESPLDRTLGKWNNTMDGFPLMDYVPGSVRERIQVRGFPRRGCGPHDHGDFDDVEQCFWRPAFWQLPLPAGR